jgi:transcriptional regulator of met regulon
MKIINYVLLACMLPATSGLTAQTQQADITPVILHLDSAFWKAYNGCDTAAFKDFFTDDVEFYHDKGGVTLGASALAQSITKNVCGNSGYRLRREAVPGTVKVYPMNKGDELYGAIITGEHVFYITQNNKPEFLDGAASFTHLWILINGKWKMKRILSYNHHNANDSIARKITILPVKVLDQLTGTYKGSQSGYMSLVRNGDVLSLKAGKNSYTLYPQSDSVFFVKDRDLLFEFTKDASGRPIKMIVKEHGAVAEELLFQK